MSIIYIYTLRDPVTNEIRYVGKTNNIKTRMVKHKRDALDENCKTSIYKNRWLRIIYTQQLEPIVEIVYQATLDDWDDWEKYFISKLKHEGCKLTNRTQGGEWGGLAGNESWNYGKSRSESTKQKLRDKAKERWANGQYDFNKKPLIEKWPIESVNKHLARMVEYNKNKVVTNETKQKISKARSIPILILDLDGNVVNEFENAKSAADFYNCERSTVNNIRRFGGIFLKKYRIVYKHEHN